MILTKHHIILYAVAIVFALGLTYVIESNVADKADAKYQQQVAVDQQKDASNTQFQQQAVNELAQIKSENDQQQVLIAQAQATIATLKQQLQDQQGKDAVLPPNDLAARIQTLAPGGKVTVAPSGYTLDQPEAVAIAKDLESVPVLTQELGLDQETISRDDTIIANDGKALADEKAAHAADNATAVIDKKTLNDQIASLKADARKSKFKWFIAGVVTGFTLGRIHNLSL
jgi:hypothetical protein